MAVSNVVREVLRHRDDLALIEHELDDEDAVVVRKVAPGRVDYGTEQRVGAEPAVLPEWEQASRRRLEQLVPASRSAVRKLVRDGASADIDEDEHGALEAIVVLLARPAILVQDGKFFPAPEPWNAVLESHRGPIESVLTRVGRVEVKGHPALDWVGTAWLAADQVLMTNRHVAMEFVRGGGTSWSFVDGMAASIDYNEELSATQPRERALVEVIGVHERFDLALLRCAPEAGEGLPVEPLPIARQPALTAGSRVYVVGYPAADSRRNDPAEMQRIFAGIYNVKRLQPGEIRSATADELVHDCSTLGGNSGSCVLDLDTSTVVGLHFGGRYLTGNFAVPLWTLADDPLLRRAGVVPTA